MMLDICDILTHQELIKSYMVHNMESKKNNKKSLFNVTGQLCVGQHSQQVRSVAGRAEL